MSDLVEAVDLEVWDIGRWEEYMWQLNNPHNLAYNLKQHHDSTGRSKSYWLGQVRASIRTIRSEMDEIEGLIEESKGGWRNEGR